MLLGGPLENSGPRAAAPSAQCLIQAWQQPSEKTGSYLLAFGYLVTSCIFKPSFRPQPRVRTSPSHDSPDVRYAALSQFDMFR